MYRLPPLIANGNVGLVVGNANIALLAAPGAGLRYRVVGGNVRLNNAVAAAVVDANLQDGAGNLLWGAAGLSLAGAPMAIIEIPAPGVRSAVNATVVVVVSSTVAAGFGVVTLYYFLEAA